MKRPNRPTALIASVVMARSGAPSHRPSARLELLGLIRAGARLIARKCCGEAMEKRRFEGLAMDAPVGK